MLKPQLKLTILCVLISEIVCQNYCKTENSVDIPTANHVKNGGKYFDNVTYKKTEYHTEKNTTKGCFCNNKICVFKCCPKGYGYDLMNNSCDKVSKEFKVPVYDKYNRPKPNDLFYNFGKPNCGDSVYRIQVTELYKFHQRDDGQLYIETPNSIPPWSLRGPDKYCIDTFVLEDSKGVKTAQLDALVCFADEQEPQSYWLSASFMLISCFFILLTVTIYCWLPELRNLHGRVLIAYLINLFVGFAFMATMQILITVDNTSVESCVILSIIIYFSLLAAFFWLNVMSFDIWWTFSGKRGISTEKMSVNRKFSAYCIYAFTCPTILTVILVSLEFSELKPHPFLPLLRQQGCFLFGLSRLIYLYFPMMILCIANVTFFILTTRKISQIKNETSVLNTRESATHDPKSKDKQRLTLYVKLSIVMGINWILEVISALYPEANSFWVFTDAYNVLIGLFIFIIFVCKKKTLFLIKKRYKQQRGLDMSRSQTTTSRTISTLDENIPMSKKN